MIAMRNRSGADGALFGPDRNPKITRRSAIVSVGVALLFLVGMIGLAQSAHADVAVGLDGQTGRVEVPHHEALNPGTENWTCAFWVKLEADFTIGHRKFISKRDGSGLAGGFYIGSHFAPACSDGNRQSLDYRNHIPVGEWIHVAVQIDRDDDKLRAFINGALVAESDSQLTGALDAKTPLVIGGDSTGSLSGNNCRIRDVRIWKGELVTVETIGRNMIGETAADADGLVAHWPMNEGAGDTVRDEVAGHDGKFAGSARWMLFTTDLTAHREFRPGETTTFGPVGLAGSVGAVSYQWFHNGAPIPGATSDRLTVTDMTEADLGTYHVLVDDARDFTPLRSSRVRLVKPDWPMWGFDAERSSATPHQLAETLHLQWVRELPEPKRAWRQQFDNREKLDFDVSYSPVVMGDRIFVPSSVSDSVTAYRVDDGVELWRYYADAPVRLAPVAWEGRVFFVSDDGYLYCVSAESGDLQWRFRGGPSDHRLLGNERIINFWSARGGPVLREGTLYFTAGIWPLHGVFVYAIDAENGEVQWVNDTISTEYVALPHGGAYGYGGLAPQGYIAASEDRLVVAGGRTPPAFLDRHTGDVVEATFRTQKGLGGYAVHAVDGGGYGPIVNEMIEARMKALSDQIDGNVFATIAARDRLFVTTEAGTLYCFGPEKRTPVHHELTTIPAEPRSDRWASSAAQLLQDLGESEGYALMLGVGSGDLLRELLARSDLHIVVAEADAGKVRVLRDELVGAGLYGRRAAVIHADPAGFTVQPYLFSMVLSEDARAAGIHEAGTLAYLLDRLRPYGGVAYLGPTPLTEHALVEAMNTERVDQVSITLQEGLLFARRGGPLTGAGQWTHQHHDPANNLLSRDERVRLPLGILWFGGPNNHNILPRHAGGPRPQVAGGRVIYLGVETIGARCVYTGRQLWEREFPGLGHPFTNMELEERWRGGAEVYMTNIPGATYIGSPLVTLADALYLRYGGSIYQLDPITGETIAVTTPPGRTVAEIYDDEDAPDYGHVSVQGDVLITTSEPHLFEDQVLGWTESYSGTSSRRIAALNRHTGRLLWEREARIGFRHNAIVSRNDTLFVIDGLSESAIEHLARRGQVPDEPSVILALELETGQERWRNDSEVFGTYLLYSAEHDILIEGGSMDLRRQLDDEPRHITARRGATGEVLWEGGHFVLPGAIRGEMLIPGRPGGAISVLTGENWMRTQPYTGQQSRWTYRRAYGCNTLSASPNLLFYRSGYASFFDLEHDTGTGNLSGFRSGCTANMMAADGVLNALDYTRTCTCSYAHQTSLALIHMPGDSNIELWTRYDASPPDPAGHGINFGAPGRRADDSGRVWHNEEGTHRRHPSVIRSNGGGLNWVAASARERAGEITVDDLIDTTYTVRLHFAELDGGVEAGQRVFDVLIDGETVLGGFDIAGETGGPFRGTVKEFSVKVSGNQMTIDLRKSDDSKRDPMISGVEITAVGLDALASAQ
jgi:outer membrane protein assembly factor BamB